MSELRWWQRELSDEAKAWLAEKFRRMGLLHEDTSVVSARKNWWVR